MRCWIVVAHSIQVVILNSVVWQRALNKISDYNSSKQFGIIYRPLTTDSTAAFSTFAMPVHNSTRPQLGNLIA